MKAPNPMIRLNVNVVSSTGDVNRIGRLYLRYYDDEWIALEIPLAEIWEESRPGVAYDDAPALSDNPLNPVIDPLTGNIIEKLHDCYVDFSVLALLKSHVDGYDVHSEILDQFFDILVKNARKECFGKDPSEYAIHLSWVTLMDEETIYIDETQEDR